MADKLVIPSGGRPLDPSFVRSVAAGVRYAFTGKMGTPPWRF